MTAFTDILAAHRFRAQDHSTIAYRSHCYCGWWDHTKGKREIDLHAAHVEAMLTAAGIVTVETALWEQAKDLMREQDRSHAWDHFCELSDVRCDCCGDRHAERDDYTCCGDHNHAHEYTDWEIAKALRCGGECPPWSPFHVRAETFPFNEYDPAARSVSVPTEGTTP